MEFLNLSLLSVDSTLMYIVFKYTTSGNYARNYFNINMKFIIGSAIGNMPESIQALKSNCINNSY
ncbi:MAG: hypothetical protein JWR12_2219 [Mucilaginibacter sp.]|nr:hypothetical protein [Mucilaginibacter sp.]